ncbi:MAG: DUF3618 domain-containing protein [Cupriavidus sp.]|nr:DUF3618 domain-containing protein [Cupriavidus sp.]
MNREDRSSEQIQSDIERTRRELDRTLTLLERRLEPRRLVDQGVDYLRDNGAREYLSNLGRSAREQPLPLALVGVGLAWMMMTNGRAGTGTYADRLSPDESAGAAASRAGEGMEALRSRAGELGNAVTSAVEQTRNAAQRTTQSLSEAADAARARAARVGEATRHAGQRLHSGYDHLVNEQPLALGAIGLALGAVLAAAAPRTRQEDEWLGGSSDRLMDDARRAAKAKVDEVQDAIRERRADGDAEAAEPRPLDERGSFAAEGQMQRQAARQDEAGAADKPPF